MLLFNLVDYAFIIFIPNKECVSNTEQKPNLVYLVLFINQKIFFSNVMEQKQQ